MFVDIVVNASNRPKLETDRSKTYGIQEKARHD